MKRFHITRKKTILAACIAIPAIAAAIFIPKVVKARKYKRYTTV